MHREDRHRVSSVIQDHTQKMTLEQALEFIEDDELVEVTPQAIRIRKVHLLEHERKRASREKETS